MYRLGCCRVSPKLVFHGLLSCRNRRCARTDLNVLTYIYIYMYVYICYMHMGMTIKSVASHHGEESNVW